MGQIPEDAIHWDSGDWIAWHRTSAGLDKRPCGAAAEDDPLARLTALLVSLLRAAKTYFVVTGHHLPLYPSIAEVYAAINFGLQLGGDPKDQNGVKLMHIPPHGPTNTVEVDLAEGFEMLVIVRIKDNFEVEARSILRNKLPGRSKGLCKVSWQNLPRRS